MIAYQEARGLVEQLARTQMLTSSNPEDVLTQDSLNAEGYILAEDLHSSVATPPFANSAMDGYAVSTRDFAGATFPCLLPLHAESAAGQRVVDSLKQGSCMRIMTGAPLPAGADAVVRREDVQELGSQISFAVQPEPGSHVRLAGEDFQPGELVYRSGTPLDAVATLVLSGLGIAEVKVMRQLEVGILATGNELVDDPKAPISGSQIRNSSSPFLLAALRRTGVKATYFGRATDELGTLVNAFQQALASPLDTLLTTGAVSEGAYDCIPSAIKEMGGEIIFHKIAIRPGKPLLLARIPRSRGRDLIFFGLPGNPISSLLGWRFFFEPYRRRVIGMADEKWSYATLASAIKSKPAVTCFYKAKVEPIASGVNQIHILPGQMSFMTKPLAEANAWAILADNRTSFEQGEAVPWVPVLPHLS